MKRLFCFLLFAFALILSACTPPQASLPLPLASFTESSVEVSIALARDSSGQFSLAATFTPTEADMHLYSKDLPLEGQDDLGRPTLLELIPSSSLMAAGELTADAEPFSDPDDGYGLPLYPAGPVTLRLPVSLPNGDGWVDAQVSVTYMACSGYACRAPVIGKVIDIRVPSLGMLTP